MLWLILFFVARADSLNFEHKLPAKKVEKNSKDPVQTANLMKQSDQGLCCLLF